MTISNVTTISNQYIIDADTAQNAVLMVVATLRSDISANAASTLKEVRTNVFTYSSGDGYFVRAYVETFFGEFRVTTTFNSVK